MAEARKKLFKAGTFVYLENEEDTDEVYVLEEGQVELANAAGIRRLRPTLGSGDIFGFTACLCRRPRMETAAARTDCRVAAMDRDGFIEHVQSRAELATKIISYFAEELRAYDELMMREAPDTAADESRLFELAGQFLARRRPAEQRPAGSPPRLLSTLPPQLSFLGWMGHFAPPGMHTTCALASYPRVLCVVVLVLCN